MVQRRSDVVSVTMLRRRDSSAPPQELHHRLVERELLTPSQLAYVRLDLRLKAADR
jgi:hypothetical protein